jgi:PEGA domain
MTWWWFTDVDRPYMVEGNYQLAERVASVPPPPKPPSESSLIQPLKTLPTPVSAPRGAHGTLLLNVEPSSAEVYVDGFYVSTVADFSQSPSGRDLSVGWHRLEFRARGYETPAINVTIEPNRTFTYRGELKAIGR